MKKNIFACALAALTLFGFSAASAQDKVKLAIGQRGNWDTSVSEVGQVAGIFKKHGLELEIVYTNGAGETQQAVISGSVDIGIAAGVMGVLGPFGAVICTFCGCRGPWAAHWPKDPSPNAWWRGKGAITRNLARFPVCENDFPVFNRVIPCSIV